MITIVPFNPVYQDAVIDQILPIQQQEYGIAITLQEQPDLLDIPGFYQHHSGNFRLALAESKIVGSIALLEIGDGLGILRKKFVAAPFRGKPHGAAQYLLDALLDWCELNRMRDIYLGTTAQFIAAQRFYRKIGFTEIAMAKPPARFQVMTVDSEFFTRKVSLVKFGGDRVSTPSLTYEEKQHDR